MCGRFITRDQAATEREFSVVLPLWSYSPHFNITLTSRLEPNVPAIHVVDRQRVGRMMRWPLIRASLHGTPPPFSTFNAAAEGLTTKSTWRSIWNNRDPDRPIRRCILPAGGFYEWQWNGEEGVASVVQPYFIRPIDQDIYGFAGLWGISVRPPGWHRNLRVLDRDDHRQ